MNEMSSVTVCRSVLFFFFTAVEKDEVLNYGVGIIQIFLLCELLQMYKKKMTFLKWRPLKFLMLNISITIKFTKVLQGTKYFSSFNGKYSDIYMFSVD